MTTLIITIVSLAIAILVWCFIGFTRDLKRLINLSAEDDDGWGKLDSGWRSVRQVETILEKERNPRVIGVLARWKRTNEGTRKQVRTVIEFPGKKRRGNYKDRTGFGTCANQSFSRIGTNFVGSPASRKEGRMSPANETKCDWIEAKPDRWVVWLGQFW